MPVWFLIVRRDPVDFMHTELDELVGECRARRGFLWGRATMYDACHRTLYRLVVDDE